ncbi:MAG TPA: hypothetical protein VIJ12_08630 [Candidatus Baltobacteraceae bacterium]
MVIRSVCAIALFVASLATFAVPAQAAPRTFDVVNRTSERAALIYKRYPSGTLLLHVGIPVGNTQSLQVPSNTEIYVWIDRAGCPTAWVALTAKTGDNTFEILPNCKVGVTSSNNSPVRLL